MDNHIKGLQLFKGDIVKYETQLYEVASDNQIVNEPSLGPTHWGSVYLKDFHPPVFTHKGDIEIVARQSDIQRLAKTDKIYLVEWHTDHLITALGYENEAIVEQNLSELLRTILANDLHVMIKKSNEPEYDYLVFVDDKSFSRR